MTDKEKNLAIYQAMCEIATNYFNRVIEERESFREFMAEQSIISLKELTKCDKWRYESCYVDGEVKQIKVDTFSCSYPEDDFGMLSYFRSLAGVKQELFFAYEEQIENEFVGTVDIDFDKPANAKAIASHTHKDELRPIMTYVLVEIDTKTCDINFVASDGHTLGVISNNPSCVKRTPDADDLYQALFTRKDWERICDYSKKSKSPVTFELYRRKGEESQDTMLAHADGKRIRSKVVECRYPNWRSVIQSFGEMSHFNIHSDDVKAAQTWLQKVKADDSAAVHVSFYRGSDLVYFDIIDRDYERSVTRSFRLARKSDKTICVMFKIKALQKIKFTGFSIQDYDRATLVNDQNADIMVVMPMMPNIYSVPNVEQREVVSVCESIEAQTAVTLAECAA